MVVVPNPQTAGHLVVPGCRERIHHFPFYLLSNSERCLLYLLAVTRISNCCLLYVIQYTVDLRLLLYLENTSFILSCIYLPHVKAQSVKILSDSEPVRGAKKVGDRYCRGRQVTLAAA